MVNLKIERTGSFNATELIRKAEHTLAEANKRACQAVVRSIAEGELRGDAAGKWYASKRDLSTKSSGLKFRKAFGNPAAERGAMHHASAPWQEPKADRGYRGGLLSGLKIDLSLNKGPHPIAWAGWDDAEFAMIASVQEHGNAAGTLERRPFADKAARNGISDARLWIRVSGMQGMVTSRGTLQVLGPTFGVETSF